ncbi:hypothetical protein BaRGS_00003525, partial [Batillaria attramentaria]
MPVRYFKGTSREWVRSRRVALLDDLPESTDTCPVRPDEGPEPWVARLKSCVGDPQPVDSISVLVRWTMATRSCYMPWLEHLSSQKLHLAVAHDDTKSCCELVKKEENLKAVDVQGNTALIVAAAVPGDESNRLVRTLLQCFHDPDERAKYVNMTNDDGLTALHFAVLASRPSLVQLLLDVGADPNAGIYSTRDGEWFGLTPLHFSLSGRTNESARCRQFLLEAGADPNVEMACCSDYFNTASLVIECDCGGCWSKDLVTMMVPPRYGESTSQHLCRAGSFVTLASCVGDYDAVADMLQSNKLAKVDVPNCIGWTALSWSVYNREPTLVQTLIDAGANVNLQDNMGRTALMLACIDQSTEIVTKLLESGADPDLEDNDGFTALVWACCGGCVLRPALFAMLQTRVPRRLLTLPWYDYNSPLLVSYRYSDGDTLRILFRAGIANHREVKH